MYNLIFIKNDDASTKSKKSVFIIFVISRKKKIKSNHKLIKWWWTLLNLSNKNSVKPNIVEIKFSPSWIPHLTLLDQINLHQHSVVVVHHPIIYLGVQEMSSKVMIVPSPISIEPNATRHHHHSAMWLHSASMISWLHFSDSEEVFIIYVIMVNHLDHRILVVKVKIIMVEVVHH